MEKISDRQLSGVAALIIISGILMSGGSDRSMQNAWVAAAVSVVASIPLFLVFGRIHSIFPGKGLFEIAVKVLGKAGGKVFISVMSLYAFFMGAMSLRIFSEFNRVVSMPETSRMLTMVVFSATCLYIVKKGMGTLGSFSAFALPLIVFVILLINLLSFGEWKLHYGAPFMHNVGGNFFNDIFLACVFPLGEVVFVCTLFGFRKEGGKCGKIFLKGLLVGGGLLVLETLRSIMVLGANTISLLYYPSYTATGVINIMDFFTRAEVTVSTSFFVAQIVKVCVCIYTFSSGFGFVLGGKSYKSLAAPCTFGMIALGTVLFENTVEMYEFPEVYKYYALALQWVLPVLLWIGAEFVSRREKRLSEPVL